MAATKIRSKQGLSPNVPKGRRKKMAATKVRSKNGRPQKIGKKKATPKVSKNDGLRAPNGQLIFHRPQKVDQFFGSTPQGRVNFLTSLKRSGQFLSQAPKGRLIFFTDTKTPKGRVNIFDRPQDCTVAPGECHCTRRLCHRNSSQFSWCNGAIS